jgi:hypothetical protein
MKEILLLNPSKRRRRTKKRATKKSTTRKRATKKRTTVRRRVTKNPAKSAAAKKGTTTMARKRKKPVRRIRRKNPSRRRTIRRAGSRGIRGLNFKSALKNIPLNTFGMFAAKWAAKRFGDAATETDPATWNYASYLKGAGGAAAAGFLMNMIRPGTGQRVLEGGMSLMLYKLVQNEMIAGSSFWSGQLGAEEEEGYSPGDVETDSSGAPYILGDDRNWYPLTGEEETGMYGGDQKLVAPGPLGDALVPPGPLGAASDVDNLMVRSFLVR